MTTFITFDPFTQTYFITTWDYMDNNVNIHNGRLFYETTLN
jgi:hypothetical protein